MVKGNWEVYEEDFEAITLILKNLVRSGNARSVLLVDKTGHLVNSVGEPPGFDAISFASLAAADFAANAMLAEMVGEPDFSTLVHQGANSSLYLSLLQGDLGNSSRPNRVILVVLFDRKTSLGLVRLKARRAGEELTVVLNRLFNKIEYRNEDMPTPVLGADFRAEADREIDSLFQD